MIIILLKLAIDEYFNQKVKVYDWICIYNCNSQAKIIMQFFGDYIWLKICEYWKLGIYEEKKIFFVLLVK